MAQDVAARRAAARRLFEETSADPAWIAGALGIKAETLRTIAAKGGWRRLADGAADPIAGGEAGDARHDPLGSTLDRLIRQLSGQLAVLEAEAATGGAMSKPHLDALLAITRTFDRLSEMKREDDARGQRVRDEGALTRARDIVERRVGELAQQRAETIIDHPGRVAEGD